MNPPPRDVLRALALAIGLLVLLATPVHVQTTTQTLNWTQPSDTLVNIQGYTFSYTFTLNGTGNGAAIALKATCVALGAPATSGASCSAPLTTTLAVGSVLTLTATDAYGSTSAQPFTFAGMAPGTPSNISVVVTISVPGD
jgi:hypothetical protein